MSRSTIAVVTVLVLALLGSTAGLVMASQTTPDFAGQPAILAPGPVPQPADDGHHDGSHFKFEGTVTVDNRNGSPTGTIEVTSGEPVTVEITADTEIEHGPIQVGDWVEVKGRPNSDATTIIAEKVEVKDHHDEEGGECRKEEFYGLLTDWSGGTPTPGTEVGDTWTVGSIIVEITANTEIKGTPTLNALVEVEACRQDGTLLARELKVRHHGDHGHDDRVEFRGTINELPTGAPFPSGPPWKGVWKVGDWFVEVTTDTAIVGLPKLNREAEVHGSKAPDGSGVDVIASKIEIEDHHPPGQGVEIVKIEGAITALPTDPKVVEAVWEIEGIPITVVTDTLILDQRAGIAVDVWADVHAIVQRDTDGNLVSYDAIRIKTKHEEEPPGEVHFKGFFKQDLTPSTPCDGADWDVSGWEVCVPSSVRATAPPADTRVKIKAMYNAGAGTYQAFKVEVRGEDHD